MYTTTCVSNKRCHSAQTWRGPYPSQSPVPSISKSIDSYSWSFACKRLRQSNLTGRKPVDSHVTLNYCRCLEHRLRGCTSTFIVRASIHHKLSDSRYSIGPVTRIPFSVLLQQRRGLRVNTGGITCLGLFSWPVYLAEVSSETCRRINGHTTPFKPAISIANMPMNATRLGPLPYSAHWIQLEKIT